MIVIYKETKGDGSLMNMDMQELLCTVDNSTIDKEVMRLRKLYGDEYELDSGRLGDGVCMRYKNGINYYVMRS